MIKKIYKFLFFILFSVIINSCEKQTSPETVDDFPKKDTVNRVKLNEKIKRNDIAKEIPIYDKTTDPKTAKYDFADVSSIKNINKFSCDEKSVRFIALSQKDDVRLILVPQDCGDFDYRYYLLIIKNNSVVSNLYVEGIWQELDDESSKEITTFEIDHNFTIIVTTTLSQSSKITKYKINAEGKLVEI